MKKKSHGIQPVSMRMECLSNRYRNKFKNVKSY